MLCFDSLLSCLDIMAVSSSRDYVSVTISAVSVLILETSNYELCWLLLPRPLADAQPRLLPDEACLPSLEWNDKGPTQSRSSFRFPTKWTGKIVSELFRCKVKVSDNITIELS